MVQPVVQKTRRQIIQGAAAVGRHVGGPGADGPGCAVRVGIRCPHRPLDQRRAGESRNPTTCCGPKQQTTRAAGREGRPKRKIELISSDDRSDTETVVRTYEN